ncbi:MAG: hypothetical protein EBY18_12265 [Alphaproteobacteria bacterium]|nr:hypothetical protein [Alphaproteobacteria bacterium]
MSRGERRRPAGIAVAALAAINLAGIAALAWFAVHMLVHDGVMAIELSMCAGLMALLAAITAGGVALQRLALAAVPTIAAFGFLLYLDSHPIDWR